MSALTPSEAADILDANLPWDLWRLAGEDNELVAAARVVLSSARASTPTALRRAVREVADQLDPDHEDGYSPDSDGRRAAQAKLYRLAASEGDLSRIIADSPEHEAVWRVVATQMALGAHPADVARAVLAATAREQQ